MHHIRKESESPVGYKSLFYAFMREILSARFGIVHHPSYIPAHIYNTAFTFPSQDCKYILSVLCEGKMFKATLYSKNDTSYTILAFYNHHQHKTNDDASGAYVLLSKIFVHISLFIS